MSGVSSESTHLTAPRMRLALGPACLPRDRARSLRARLRWMLKCSTNASGPEKSVPSWLLSSERTRWANREGPWTAGGLASFPERKEATMGSQIDGSISFGLTGQRIRESLEQELVRAMRAEGGVPTIHAIAHSVARVLEDDHLRMVDQLRRAGVQLEDGG